MSLFNDNLKFLSKLDKNNYKNIIHKLESISKKDINIEECKSKNNFFNIKIKNENREYYLHSSYDPIYEGNIWAETVDSTSKFVVVIGLGLGYHIKSLLKKLDSKAVVCVIEPDINIFKVFLENVNMKEVFDERVTLILNSNYKEIALEMFAMFAKYIMEKVNIKIFNSYNIEYSNLLENVEKEFVSLIHNISVNIATSEYFKYQWSLNILANCSRIKGAANAAILHEKFKNIPIIIVSAGPSLSENIEVLKGLKDKALIIAGGSAIGILKKHDINPHFMLAIDGAPEEKEIFRNIDFSGVSLIYVNRLYYEIVKEYKEKRFLFIDTEDFVSKYFAKKVNMDYVEIPPSQTVAGINIDLAYYFGGNPVLFVGQDLAYTNLEMHAEGAAHMVNFKEEVEKNPNKFISMKDIYGKDIYTIKPFLTTRKSMEDKMIKYMKAGFKFINCSEGGIGFESISNENLKKVSDKYLVNTYNFEEIIDEAYREGQIKICEETVEKFIGDLINNGEELKKIVSARYDLAEKALKILSTNLSSSTNSGDYYSIDYEEYKKNALQINKYEKQLENNEFYREFVVGSISHILNIHKAVMEKELRNTDNIIEQNKIKIKSIMNSSAEILGFCNFILNSKNQFQTKQDT